jgi:hypothetical protein
MGLARELSSNSRPAPVMQLLKEELRLAETKQVGDTHMTTYGRLHIPGLLQTGEWGRAIMAIYDPDPEVVARGWALRRGRQELTRAVPQGFFIGETALRGVVFGVGVQSDYRQIHRDQLAHLLYHQSSHSPVSIRVLPNFAERILQEAYHRASSNKMGVPIPEFVVLEGARGRVSVYSDGLEERSVVEPPGIVEGLAKDRILAQRNAMASLALSPAESVDYITQIADSI